MCIGVIIVVRRYSIGCSCNRDLEFDCLKYLRQLFKVSSHAIGVGHVSKNVCRLHGFFSIFCQRGILVPLFGGGGYRHGPIIGVPKWSAARKKIVRIFSLLTRAIVWD